MLPLKSTLPRSLRQHDELNWSERLTESETASGSETEKHCVADREDQNIPPALLNGNEVYLEEAVVVDDPILVVQKRQEGVLCVQQHLPLPLLLSLPGSVRSLLQRQDLTETYTENK